MKNIADRVEKVVSVRFTVEEWEAISNLANERCCGHSSVVRWAVRRALPVQIAMLEQLPKEVTA